MVLLQKSDGYTPSKYCITTGIREQLSIALVLRLWPVLNLSSSANVLHFVPGVTPWGDAEVYVGLWITSLHLEAWDHFIFSFLPPSTEATSSSSHLSHKPEMRISQMYKINTRMMKRAAGDHSFSQCCLWNGTIAISIVWYVLVFCNLYPHPFPYVDSW